VAETLQPLRALVIEDCEDDYDLLLLKLREAGYAAAAVRVETVAEIREALAAEDWQIVVSDFDLPGFDGLRALELVRAGNPEVPFFIVSGVIDEGQAVAAMKAGAQDYFFKGKLARLGPAVSRELHEVEERHKHSAARQQLDRDRNLLRHDRIRFVDVMSHEFRTPLNIINVAAGMLGRYGERMDASARRERITEIQDAVLRMTRMIDQVLLTSRLELRKWDLRCDTFDPAAWNSSRITPPTRSKEGVSGSGFWICRPQSPWINASSKSLCRTCFPMHSSIRRPIRPWSWTCAGTMPAWNSRCGTTASAFPPARSRTCWSPSIGEAM